MNNENIVIGGKSYKKCKVIMLPSDKSNLYKHLLGSLRFSKNEKTDSDIIKPQHLYIVSSEEIKEGDYYYDKEDKIIFKCLDTLEATSRNDYKEIYECERWFKVLASTDSTLGLPRPSNAFLEAYCKAKGEIDEVLVECFPIYKSAFHGKIDCDFEGIVDRYEVKKAPDNTITIKPIKDSWNREEVEKLFIYGISEIVAKLGYCCTSDKMKEINIATKTWLEENL